MNNWDTDFFNLPSHTVLNTSPNTPVATLGTPPFTFKSIPAAFWSCTCHEFPWKSMNKIKYLFLVCFFFKHTCGINWASQAAVVVKNPLPVPAGSLVGKIRLPVPAGSLVGKIRLPVQAGSLGWEDPLEKGTGNPLQCSFLGKSHGQRSLAGYSPWGHRESDTTAGTEHAFIG